MFLELANRNQNFRFVKFSTETNQNGWNSIGFSFWSVVGFCALRVFFFQNFFVWAFFKKCNIQAVFLSFSFSFFGFWLLSFGFWFLSLFMLFVIKPFLETYFRPFFRNQFWPRFGPFLFWPFRGLF